MRSDNCAWKIHGLKLFAAAGLGAAILMTGASPAVAFGHDKLRDTLNRLSQPPAAPRQAPAPAAKPAPARQPRKPRRRPGAKRRSAPSRRSPATSISSRTTSTIRPLW
jgi:hypothetical protein